MTLIAIIVPIYKVEPYIRRCLDSILSQTFTNFECILVDDASPDNCPKICDEYSNKDKRFKVVHKEKNEGLPEARKTGLKLVTSEFLMHVDSDDWLEQCALEKLYNKQCETNADVVIGSFKIYKNEKIRECVFNEYILSNKHKMISDYFLRPYKNVWGKLYRSSLYEQIIQPSNVILGEDNIVNIQIICSNKCRIITFIKDIVYNYDFLTGGISQNLVCTEERAINFIESYAFAFKILKQKGYLDNCIKESFYTNMFSTAFVKLFYNVQKRKVLYLIKKNGFHYIYYPANKKILFYNIMNCLFLINQNLYKIIIRKYVKLNQKKYKG